ncbi:SapC family protein [Methylobacterium sp. WL120]|uniref:SapC family protein n=1 Tax=Methylobacterium sp. WL120 TaxID=2603887 RepID=UPI0011C8C137|nr:SapC family protein [Methylobacterium sp. WL120]TXM65490.1 SapC family protein [Methylobacterium sp. WL120]
MRALEVLSYSRHGSMKWRRSQNYIFAAHTNLVGLAAAELSQAALAFPLTFVQEAGHWSLCALLGLFSDQNLYVDGQGGWRGAYVPANLRAHPFHLGWDGPSGVTLCVDEASGLITQDGTGEAIFDGTGGLVRPVADVWIFLAQTAKSILSLEKVCSQLAEARLLVPWAITLETPGGGLTVPGLHRLDEAALSGLDDDAFTQLRRTGALPVAYAQLLSMNNLTQLAQLAQARVQAEAAERAKAEVKPMIMLPEDNTIDWDWSKVGR